MVTPQKQESPLPLSGLYRYFLGPFLAISIATIVFLVLNEKQTWNIGKVCVLTGFVSLIVLAVVAIYWDARRELCLRIAAVLVVLGVGAYLVSMLQKQGLNPSNWPLRRSAQSVPNAFLACLVFGLPALFFAIRGFPKDTDAQRLAELERELEELEEVEQIESSKEVAGRIGPATTQHSKN